MSGINITVLFATNRNWIGGSQCFGNGRTQSTLYRVGDVDVRVKAGALKKPWMANKGHITIGTTRVFSNASVGLNGLAAKCGNSPGVLCFIPGFMYTFKDSIRRAALLATLYSKDAKRPLVTVVFSWPSQGRLFAYRTDWHMAQDSGPAITQAMKDLAQCCGRPYHLVAHSMGAHALACAIPSLGGAQTRLFDTAILAAADTDRDALQSPQKLGNLAHLANSVHCYIHKQDHALLLAKWPMGQLERLGRKGPMPSSVHNFSGRLAVVKCCGLTTEWHEPHRILDERQHQYYRMNPTAIEDIKAAMGQQSAFDSSFRRRRPVKHGLFRLVEPRSFR